MIPFSTTGQGLPLIDVDGSIPKHLRNRFAASVGYAIRHPNRHNSSIVILRACDPANAFLWKFVDGEPRGLGGWGSWSFAFPVRASRTNAVRPLADRNAFDADFLELFAFNDFHGEREDELFAMFSWMLNGYGRADARLPIGTEGVLVASTGHGTRRPLVMPAGGPLVAASPEFARSSRHVFDVGADGRLGDHGPLHGLVRVVELPRDPRDQNPVFEAGPDPNKDTHIPALNLGTPGYTEFGMGGGACIASQPPVAHDPQNGNRGALILHYLSALFGGIVHTGFENDRHAIVPREPGKLPVNPAHFNPRAAWALDEERDGPMAFSDRLFLPSADVVDEEWEQGGRMAAAWVETFLSWDPRTQTFRWQTPTSGIGAIIESGDMPAAAGNTIINNVNVNVNINVNIGPIVNNHWHIHIHPNRPLRPGGGDLIDPRRERDETAFPSIHGWRIRKANDEPYDDRFGGQGPPIDTEGTESGADGGPTGGLTGGFDPGPPAGSPEGTEDIEPVPGPTSGQDAPVDPETSTPPAGSITGEVTGKEGDQPDTEAAQRVREAAARQAEYPLLPPFAEKDLVASSHAIGGTTRTTKPGDLFKRSGTVPGGWWDTPPEIVPDAVAPKVVSDFSRAVYTGRMLDPDPEVLDWAEVGNSGKLGHGYIDQSTGALRDAGYVEAVIDADGDDAVDTARKFLDKSGDAHLRRHSLHGRPCYPWYDHTGTTLSGTAAAWDPVAGETPGAIVVDVGLTGFQLYGIVAGQDGDELMIYNGGSTGGDLVLNHLSGSGTSGAKIVTTAGSGTTTIAAGKLCRFRYEANFADSGNGAWLQL